MPSTFQPRVVAHGDLTPRDLNALAALFDREYREEHGTWDPDQPYGYAPASTHAIVFDSAGAAVAHVGFQRREVSVGDTRTIVAGTGGVLVDDRLRGQGLGEAVMKLAQDAMRAEHELEFGYLGCREEVVPFYVRTGWHRIHVVERSASRLLAPESTAPESTTVEEGSPVLIYPLRRAAESWPSGDVDLRGRPW